MMVFVLCLLASAGRPPSGGGPIGSGYALADGVKHTDFGANVRVWYATSGPHAVLAGDKNANSIPDFVETVGTEMVEVSAALVADGWKPAVDDSTLGLADDGGDSRIDIYLLDFARGADGIFVFEGCTAAGCGGYLAIENDFADYGYPSISEAITVLVSHEFMHAIGAAYVRGQPSWWDEGTAVWSEYNYGGVTQDPSRLMSIWVASPERSLLEPPRGPFDNWSYAGSTYVTWLGLEKGAAAVRAGWASAATGKAIASDADWNAFVLFAAQKHTGSDAALWNAIGKVKTKALVRDEPTQIVRVEPMAASYLKISVDEPARLQVGDCEYGDRASLWLVQSGEAVTQTRTIDAGDYTLAVAAAPSAKAAQCAYVRLVTIEKKAEVVPTQATVAPTEQPAPVAPTSKGCASTQSWAAWLVIALGLGWRGRKTGPGTVFSGVSRSLHEKRCLAPFFSWRSSFSSATAPNVLRRHQRPPLQELS